jgi:hypothetical protein
MAKKEKEVEEQISDDEPVFESLDDVIGTVATEFKRVRAWGNKVARIGSLSAGQMINFLENNEVQAKRRRNGLILIAQSLVDKDGKRLVNTEDNEALEQAVNRLMKQDANVNGKLVDIILELNGLNIKDAKEIAKNASGGAAPGASPIA